MYIFLRKMIPHSDGIFFHRFILDVVFAFYLTTVCYLRIKAVSGSLLSLCIPVLMPVFSTELSILISPWEFEYLNAALFYSGMIYPVLFWSLVLYLIFKGSRLD